MNDYFLIIACVLRLPKIRTKKETNFILKFKRILIGKLKVKCNESEVSKTAWDGRDGCGPLLPGVEEEMLDCTGGRNTSRKLRLKPSIS